VRFTAEELVTRRNEVSEQIAAQLREKLIRHGLVLDEFSIANFAFSPSFTNAIEAKVNAEQKKLEADRDLLRIQVEAEQRIASARRGGGAAPAASRGNATALGAAPRRERARGNRQVERPVADHCRGQHGHAVDRAAFSAVMRRLVCCAYSGRSPVLQHVRVQCHAWRSGRAGPISADTAGRPSNFRSNCLPNCYPKWTVPKPTSADFGFWPGPSVCGRAEQRSLVLPAAGLQVSWPAGSITRREPDGSSAPAHPPLQGVVAPAGHVVPVADEGQIPLVQRDFRLLRVYHGPGGVA
jgi:SPFH domain / Band 7 family